MSALQSCKKLLRKHVKTRDKSKKLRNTAVATYFANEFHCYKFLKCFIINLHKNSFNKSKTKTLTCYI